MVFFFLSSELNMEYNPSDHPRASTIFLSKSQTDGERDSMSSDSQDEWDHLPLSLDAGRER